LASHGASKTFVVLSKRCENGINVIGPFRRPNGTFEYSFADCVVTERELLDLARAGKLDAAGVSELTAKIAKNSA